MKKFLSLVLALVMAMSLVTVSAGAKDFTDDDSITYKEAVDVMSAVSVINGYADGSFGATGTLTRGAAAKIICNLILGPTTAEALAADAAPFKDVPADHTFAGYIAYCSQQGIINGYADGTFRPAGTLNGYAFMKMLLGALGYDGEVEGFTGANWTIQVAKLALGAGLDDGLKDSFVGSKAVTREEACLYALNTVKATMVQYDSKTNIVIGDASIQIGSKAEQVPQDGYKNIYDPITEKNLTLQFGEKYFPNLKLTTPGDALGRKANTWKFKNTEIGTYPTEDAVLVYTSDMSSTSGKSEVTKALKGYDLDNVDVYFNGNTVEDQKVTAADIAEYTGNGILVEVYADGTVVERVVVVNSYIGQVSKVNKTDETITVDFKDTTPGTSLVTTVGYGDFEKDDYVMVSPVCGSNGKADKAASKDDAVVVAAEKVTGTVSNVTSTKVVLDGEAYKFAENNAMPSSIDLKDDIDVYLDAYGYAVYSANVATKDLLYVVTTYEKTGSWDKEDPAETWVQAVNTDGLEVNYKLDSKSSVQDPEAGKLYSYTVSGNKVQLKEAAAATGSKASFVSYATGEITSKTNGLTVTGGTAKRYFTDETVFISVSGTKGKLSITMGTGKQLVEDDDAAYAIIAVAEKKNSQNADISVVFVNKTITADSITGLVLLSDGTRNGIKELNGTDYNTYEVYVDGEKQDIPVDSFSPDATVGMLYTVSQNSDGAYKLVERTTNVKANTVANSVYGSWLDVADYANSLDVSEATVVDLSDNDIDDVAGLKDLIEQNGAVVTVSVVFNADDEASYVYIVSAKILFTENEDGTYTVDPAIGEDLSSISYKINGKTLTTTDDTVDLGENDFVDCSVKVSTVDGYTLKGKL